MIYNEVVLSTAGAELCGLFKSTPASPNVPQSNCSALCKSKISRKHAFFATSENSAPGNASSPSRRRCADDCSTILKVLATCGCVQELPNCVKVCFECLGAFILRLFGALSLFWLGFGIYVSVSSGTTITAASSRQAGIVSLVDQVRALPFAPSLHHGVYMRWKLFKHLDASESLCLGCPKVHWQLRRTIVLARRSYLYSTRDCKPFSGACAVIVFVIVRGKGK